MIGVAMLDEVTKTLTSRMVFPGIFKKVTIFPTATKNNLFEDISHRPYG